MLDERRKIVSVWLGNIPQKKTFDEYTKWRHERIVQEDDDDIEPVSDFAADSASQWYDASWQAAKWQRKAVPVEQLISQFDWSESFRNAATAAAGKKRVREANAAFVLYEHELKPARWPKSSPLTFICSTTYRTGTERPPIPKVPIVSAIGISPDETMAVTGALDGKLRLWDLYTGRQIGEPRKEHQKPVTRILFCNDGRRCITISNRIRSWEPFPHAKKSGAAFGERADVFAMDEENDLAAWWYTGGTQVYDLAKRKRAKLIKDDRDRVISLSFLSGGILLAIDQGGRLRWLDPLSGDCLHFEDIEMRCDAAAISPDAKRAVIAADGKLFVWDVPKQRQLADVACRPEVFQAVFASTQRLLTHHNDGSVHVWNLKHGARASQLDGEFEEYTRIIVTDRGRKAVTFVMGQPEFTVWELKTGKPVCSFSVLPDPPEMDDAKYVITRVAATNDGKTFIVGDKAERLQFLRLKRGSLVQF